MATPCRSFQFCNSLSSPSVTNTNPLPTSSNLIALPAASRAASSITTAPFNRRLSALSVTDYVKKIGAKLAPSHLAAPSVDPTLEPGRCGWHASTSDSAGAVKLAPRASAFPFVLATNCAHNAGIIGSQAAPCRSACNACTPPCPFLKHSQNIPGAFATVRADAH